MESTCKCVVAGGEGATWCPIALCKAQLIVLSLKGSELNGNDSSAGSPAGRHSLCGFSLWFPTDYHSSVDSRYYFLRATTLDYHCCFLRLPHSVWILIVVSCRLPPLCVDSPCCFLQAIILCRFLLWFPAGCHTLCGFSLWFPAGCHHSVWILIVVSCGATHSVWILVVVSCGPLHSVWILVSPVFFLTQLHFHCG